MFQVFGVLVLTGALLAVFPIVAGMAFLEKAPPRFECRQFSAGRMNNVLMNHQFSWKECTRDEICAENLQKSDYKPVVTESEYLENWVEKLDLLCRPDSQIGLLGSCFFIGIIISILWVPKTSDKVGRTNLIFLTFAAQLISQLSLYYTTSLEVAYFFMIVVGMTLPGKNIVCFNYVLECIPLAQKQFAVNFVMVCEALYVMLIAFYYQFLSKNWQYLQIFGLLQITAALLFATTNFCESPKFLFNVGRYEEARKSIAKIARFNGITDLPDFKFTEEVTIAPLPEITTPI